jgi:hypothetical protein
MKAADSESTDGYDHVGNRCISEQPFVKVSKTPFLEIDREIHIAHRELFLTEG